MLVMYQHSYPFVCMAVGDFFGKANIYIARLFGMLTKHVSRPFELYCVTDRPRNIPSEIMQIDCSHWSRLDRKQMGPTQMKIGLFNPQFIAFEDFIYLDLSLVICKSLDPLIAFARERSEDLVILKDWNYDCYNSSVMRIRNRNLRVVYDDYAEGVIYPYRVIGDQDFIHACVAAKGLDRNVAFFPAGSVVSYKNTRQKGKREPGVAYEMFMNVVIVKFHGHPKMHVALNPFYHLSKLMYYGFLRGRTSIGVPFWYLYSNWLGK